MSSYNAAGNVQYNYAQLQGIWLQAGGQAGAAPIAAAIALAESGGNTTATNQDSNGSVDRGLWQINSVHGAQSTYDVMGNARAAVAISNNGTNWTPWTTYNTGAYRRYIQTGVAPDTSAPINATNAQVNQNTGELTALQLPGGLWDPANWFLDPLGSVTQAGGNAVSAAAPTLIKYLIQGLIISMLNPLIQIMAGAMGMAAGGAMVVWGFWIVGSHTETGQQVERGVGTAASTGMMALGPEAAASTQYISRSGQMTTVSQQRRPAGRVNIGGRPMQYRPARVTTSVERPAPAPSTQQQLRTEAGAYQRRGPIHTNGNGK